MDSEDTKFLRAMKGLMRPVVRALIARGVTAPAFYKVLKSVYVDVASSDFRIDGAPATVSRITLLTGVHRRDVRAILTDDNDTWETSRSKTVMFATVLGQWLALAEYQDKNGDPKALPRTSEEGESFEALVRSINTDIRPRTVLDELLRQGLVTESKDGLLRISEAARRGPASSDDRLAFFASNLGDHIAAASENLLAEKPPFYERAVFYNNLTAEAVDEIEGRARKMSQNVLETLNKESQALRAEIPASADARERYRLGVYFYRETGEPTSTSPKEKADEDD